MLNGYDDLVMKYGGHADLLNLELKRNCGREWKTEAKGNI